MAKERGDAERFARLERPLAQVLAFGAELEAQLSGEEMDGFVLALVVLEAQRLASTDVQDLADVAVGARPDQLVPPRLLDADRLFFPHSWISCLTVSASPPPGCAARVRRPGGIDRRPRGPRTLPAARDTTGRGR